MIRFALRCADGHAFDSWFQSADAFETLAARGLLSCAVCGHDAVEKALMAPAVPARASAPGQAPAKAPADQAADPDEARHAALAALRRKVEQGSEYVGMRFATEARAIHDGDAPERPIYGEARGDEARKLIEDGVPVLPLPFMPRKRTH